MENERNQRNASERLKKRGEILISGERTHWVIELTDDFLRDPALVFTIHFINYVFMRLPYGAKEVRRISKGHE